MQTNAFSVVNTFGALFGKPSEVWFTSGLSTTSELAGRIPAGIRHFLSLVGLETPREQLLGLSALVAVILVAVLFIALSFARRGRSRDTGAPLSALTRRPRITGYFFLIVLAGFFGGWSVLAPLSSAALAPGVISPDGYRKTVEHLEGGIIQSIHVKEGDVVVAGEPLFTLDNVQARARYEELNEKYLYNLAIEARLLAELSDADTITFPSELVLADGGAVEQTMAAQKQVLTSRRATQSGRENILLQRIGQIKQQTLGLEQVILAQNLQVSLIDEEIANAQELYDQGLEKYARLLSLKRTHAAIEAEIASHRSKIAENAQRIGETRIQLLTLQEQLIERSNNELAETQGLLGELRSQMPSRADILERTVVRAPISGTVMGIRPVTETSVIRPGDVLLDIVPDEAMLIVDARVKPTDIERIRPGMEARVVLTAYRQRNLPLIHGTLRSISADRLIDNRTGESYFMAKVEVTMEDLDKLDEIRLVPGMPADVMFLNDEQTLIGYLLDPFLQSVGRSFREN